MEKIAERFFSVREYADFRALPGEQRRLAFFTCWTRKEAFIKAIGDGLSYPLRRFDVTLAPSTPAKLLHVAGDDGEAARWALHALSPATNYVGAIVVEGGSEDVHCWRLPDLATTDILVGV